MSSFHFSLFTLANAIAIGLVISAMALVTNPRLKALLYTVPIPITVGLIATNGHVGTSHVMGLFLVCCYMWAVHFLYQRGATILLADTVAAILYVLIGYLGTHVVPHNFWIAVSIYLIIWILVMFVLRRHVIDDKPGRRSRMPVVLKGSIATALSYGLYSAKDALAGIVVTFPFSGVFAVIEGRRHLGTLTRVLSRNSLAILTLFATVYALPETIALWQQLLVSWLAYGIVLKLVHLVKV